MLQYFKKIIQSKWLAGIIILFCVIWYYFSKDVLLSWYVFGNHTKFPNTAVNIIFDLGFILFPLSLLVLPLKIYLHRGNTFIRGDLYLLLRACFPFVLFIGFITYIKISQASVGLTALGFIGLVVIIVIPFIFILTSFFMLLNRYVLKTKILNTIDCVAFLACLYCFYNLSIPIFINPQLIVPKTFFSVEKKINTLVHGQLFEEVSDTTLYRSSHSSVVLNNGDVLIMGGLRHVTKRKLKPGTKDVYYNGSGEPKHKGIEIYNPVSKQFRYLDGGVPFLGSAKSVLLQNGKILICCAKRPNTLVLFDPGTNTYQGIDFWQDIKVLEYIFLGLNMTYEPTYRMTGLSGLPSITLLKNAQVLIIAGGQIQFSYGEHGGFRKYFTSNHAFIFDPKTNKVSPTGLLSCARKNHQATLLEDGKVLITGGENNLGCHNDKKKWSSETISHAEVYDPKTGQFTRVGNMKVSREDHTTTLLNDGMVLITGGVTGNISERRSVADAELYKPSEKKFTLIEKMETRRVGHTATLLTNGDVLIAGGCYQGQERDTDKVEIYKPRTREFHTIGGMSDTRCRHNATLLRDGTVLITGGTKLPKRNRTAELYHPPKE